MKHRPRLTTAIRTLFWLALAVAFVMATLPQPPQLPGQPTDKVQHILAFAVLTLLMTLGWPRLALWKAAAMMALLGAAIEFIQLVPALNRTGEFADWLADIAATVTVLAIVALARRWRAAR